MVWRLARLSHCDVSMIRQRHCIHLMLYVPNAAAKPVPVFLGLNYWGNASVEADPDIPLTDRWMRPSQEIGIVNNRATEGDARHSC